MFRRLFRETNRETTTRLEALGAGFKGCWRYQHSMGRPVFRAYHDGFERTTISMMDLEVCSGSATSRTVRRTLRQSPWPHGDRLSALAHHFVQDIPHQVPCRRAIRDCRASGCVWCRRPGCSKRSHRLIPLSSKDAAVKTPTICPQRGGDHLCCVAWLDELLTYLVQHASLVCDCRMSIISTCPLAAVETQSSSS